MTKKKNQLKYIFVVGGVMSGVGKGVASSSIAKILESRGWSVTSGKIDPYVNMDAGTMNPTEHGEVFVLDDGLECDQDMGNYERFLNRSLSRDNYMTTGSVYMSVIEKERNLEYGGKCVEVVPHIPLEVINKIKRAGKKDKAEIFITEIGGTVGEYQNVLFLEAVRMLKLKHPGNVLLVLVSYLPSAGKDNELKTKPTQYAVRSLNSAGLQPDIILARAAVPLDKKRKEKIAFNCNVSEVDVISAPDVQSIYEIPVNFEKDNLGDRMLGKLFLESRKRNFGDWRKLVRVIRTATKPVTIGIVGKYFGTGNFILSDSYISVIEAVKHAAYAHKHKPVIEWLNAEDYEPATGKDQKNKLRELAKYDGLIVPGGFGSRGIEGKISVIRYCRENKIPYFGLCYGMQLAVVEFARNVLKLPDAHTTEIDRKTSHPVIDILPEQKKNLETRDYGATMRLGAYRANLKPGTIAHAAYSNAIVANQSSLRPRRIGRGKQSYLTISERHRHRYEVNPAYISKLEKGGAIFSGASPDAKLMEIMELPLNKHPFFLGTQFHPEFKSRPLAPHPLFYSFIAAAIHRKNNSG